MQESHFIGSKINPNTTISRNDQNTEYPRTILETGSYELTTSLDGCSTNSSIFIEIEVGSTQLYIPTVFSPNLDGINDEFYPLGNLFEVLNFSIFDRWESLVHKEDAAWDGTYRKKDSPIGVYSFYLQIRNTRLDEVENHSGTFLLVR